MVFAWPIKKKGLPLHHNPMTVGCQYNQMHVIDANKEPYFFIKAPIFYKMIMKVNVLIDGGFLEQVLKKQKKTLSIAEVDAIVTEAVSNLQTKIGEAYNLSLFRVLYYDCLPFDGIKKRPDGKDVDFSKSPICLMKNTFLNDIAKYDRYGLRVGQLSFRGWKATSKGKYIPIFQQKGVDMKFGLDIAVMSMKKIVDIIIIIAGDSDFIAPLKAARKEGVLVAIQPLGLPVKDGLIKHSDFKL